MVPGSLTPSAAMSGQASLPYRVEVRNRDARSTQLANWDVWLYSRSQDQVRVAAAYGWPSDLADDEILKRLLDLNLARAAPACAR